MVLQEIFLPHMDYLGVFQPPPLPYQLPDMKYEANKSTMVFQATFNTHVSHLKYNTFISSIALRRFRDYDTLSFYVAIRRFELDMYFIIITRGITIFSPSYFSYFMQNCVLTLATQHSFTHTIYTESSHVYFAFCFQIALSFLFRSFPVFMKNSVFISFTYIGIEPSQIVSLSRIDRLRPLKCALLVKQYHVSPAISCTKTFGCELLIQYAMFHSYHFLLFRYSIDYRNSEPSLRVLVLTRWIDRNKPI